MHSRRHIRCSHVIVLIAAIAAFSLSAVSCGFGTYDDTGGAVPGQWWPWVCPDGGDPSADGGCSIDTDAGGDS